MFANIRLGDAPSADDWQGLWFYATVEGATDADGGALPSIWEADLAQGAIADRLAGGNSNVADVVVGSTIQFDPGDGRIVPVTGGAGDVRAGQSFGPQPGESDESIKASIKKTLSAFGLNPAEIKILHPLDPAVYIVATVPDPADIDGSFDEIRTALLGDPVRYEGLYLEIDLANGTPIVRNATAFRSGAGRLWITPGYDGVVGSAHGSTPR